MKLVKITKADLKQVDEEMEYGFSDAVDMLVETGMAEKKFFMDEKQEEYLRSPHHRADTIYLLSNHQKTSGGVWRLDDIELSVEKIGGQFYWRVWHD